MPGRRPFLIAAAASAWAAVVPEAHGERASGPGSGAPLRCAADRALVESGLARALIRGFGRDTGIAVLLVPGTATALLEAVRNGETDALLGNTPDAEAALEREGLVHNRHRIALGEFVLVGPPLPTAAAGAVVAAPVTAKARPAPSLALPTPLASGVDALVRLRDAAEAEPKSVRFLSAGDGSGVHVAEQALWRAAHIEPLAPWYASADPRRDFYGQRQALAAWALVERAAWAARPAGGALVVVAGDPRLAEPVHAMRAFHGKHPAAKIFLAWVGGRRGRAIAAAHRGYRAAA